MISMGSDLQDKPDGTMIAARDRIEYETVLHRGHETFRNDEIIDTPSRVPLPRGEAVAPP